MLEESTLAVLEERVNRAIDRLDDFREENQLLQKKLSRLARERATLLDRHQSTASQIKRLIAKLKREIA